MTPALSIAAIVTGLPLGILLLRQYWWRLGGARWLVLGVMALALYWLLPVDVVGRSIASGLRVAVAGIAALGLWYLRGPGFAARRRTLLLVLSPIALLAYVNFGTFHGFRAHVHFHDFAHYYLGAKYSDELFQGDLYVAMLQAEAETAEAPLPAAVRDMASYRVVPSAHVLSDAELVKQGFSEKRWNDFKRDVRLFRRGLQAQFATIFTDHGFNAAPVWLLLGKPITSLVPAGSYTGVKIVAAIDGVVLAAAFGMVAFTFGLDAMLLSLLAFCVIFGTGYSWVGGGVLRYLWFFSSLAALCCLERKRPVAAGALFALATLLRIFPFALFVPVFVRGVWLSYRKRKLSRGLTYLVGGFTATAVALVALTAFLPHGFYHWADFIAAMKVHSQNVSASNVGLLEVLGFHGHELSISYDERVALVDRRKLIELGQRVLVLLPLLVLTVRQSVRVSDVTATVLALPLIYVGISLSSYYYAVLVVYVIVMRRKPVMLASFFALQFVALLLEQLESRPILPFFYASVLLIGLWLATYLSMPKRNLALPTPAQVPVPKS